VKAIHLTLIVMLAAWFATLLFAMWIHPLLVIVLLAGVGLCLVVLGTIAVIGAVTDRSPGRTRRTLPIAGSVLAAALLFWPARRAGLWLFWRTREATLDGFISDVLHDARVRDMSDGQRFYKSLNGTLITFEPGAAVDTAHVTHATVWPLAQVLARDGIERATYERYRHRLIDLHLIEYSVTPDYVGFVYDGFLDNLNGYLWVRPGHDPPPIGAELFLTQLVVLDHLGGGWYYFATT
jgi:hypothetical protein